MSQPHEALAPTDLDLIVGRITEWLQLKPTQHQSAVEKYEAVGNWLAAPGSPLVELRPRVYPQGSMALQTTVRPLRRMEYDLDLVCEMSPDSRSAMALFDAVYARLNENATYRPILEKKNRCVRLNYDGNFHLDIIPARPDPARPPLSVVIPDRRLRDWTPSNPRGYAVWFHDRSRGIEKLRASIEPLPTQTPPDLKTTLSVAVQAIKRRRDLMFGEDDNAPRSVVLTTLAARHYRGGTQVATVVTEILAGIEAEIEAAAPHRIRVCNPTNEGERFCDSFTDEGYEAFKRFVHMFHGEMLSLRAAQDPRGFRAQLVTMFGDAPVDDVLRAHAADRVGLTAHAPVIVTGTGPRHDTPVRSVAGDAAKLSALSAIAAGLPVTPRPYRSR